VVGASLVLGHHEARRDVWLLAACPHFACMRGVLIQVPHAAPWSSLETPDDGLLLAADCVHPSAG
jgi:hypothetical protein